MRALLALLLSVAFSWILPGCGSPHDEAQLRRVSRPSPLPPLAETPPARRAAPALQPKSSALLERLGLAVRQDAEGATIIALDLDGPAAESGASVGDVILAINGAPVTSAAELDLLAGAAPRGPLLLDVRRKGERKQVAIKNVESGPAGPWNALGLQVRELPGETLKAMGVAYGIMVTKVRSPADRTRILPGDVIVGVNQTRIRSLDEFNKIIAAHEAGNVGLLVRRADSDLYIAFDLGGVPGKATGTPLRT